MKNFRIIKFMMRKIRNIFYSEKSENYSLKIKKLAI